MPWLGVARLTGLLACVAMATARIGLLLHELVGHGGAAIAFGGRIASVRLFWFAGGRIQYELDDPSLAAQVVISMAGIGVEIVTGVALALAVRGDTLARRIVRTVGAVLVVHAGWYFATGTWHGYGDGTLVYRLLGDARYIAAIAGGVVTCIAAFGGARHLFGAIVSTLPARRFAGVAIAMVVAAAVNAGLAIGELTIRHDAMYGAIMTSERERTIQRDYARWLAQAGATDDASRERELRRLERDNPTFPFAWLLAACVAGSAVAGAWRSRAPFARSALTGRAVAVAAGVAAGSIAAVVVLDQLLGV